MANNRPIDASGRTLFDIAESGETWLSEIDWAAVPAPGALGGFATETAILACTAAYAAQPSAAGASGQDVAAGVDAETPVMLSVASVAVTMALQSSVATARAGAPTGAAAIPSWVATLATAAIRTDMAAAIVNGTVGYAGLEKIFANVGAVLTASNAKLTAAQFADLKTIAANLNNGVSTSAYLVSVTNALVNGDPANATWTGGGKTAVSLGNLAAGGTATQLNELVGKWFLGTDLPSSSVVMNGHSPFSVTYQKATGSIYGAGGPSMNDINQGYLGDCYLLASLSEVARQSPSTIASMLVDNGNNTYGVRFYVNGVAKYVTVDNELANGGNIFDRGPNLWAQLVEKAYAQFQTTALSTGNSVNYGDSWSTIGNGGWPRYALEAVTGAASLTDFIGSGASWTIRNYNAAQAVTSSGGGYSSSFVLSTLVSDLTLGYDLVLSSWTNAKDSAGHTTLVASHALSIYGYDTGTGMFQIRNPWGGTNSASQSWDTTFEVSLSTLLSAGDTITVANVPATPILVSQLSISGLAATAFEGNSGTTALTFTVTRTGATGSAVSAAWTVAGTGANAANATDFTGGVLPSGTVAFAAGETSKIVTVNVAGDTVVESDETFAVTLSAPTAGTTIGTAVATGTILNDDSQLSIAALSAAKAGGSSGSTPFTFTVTRVGFAGAAASANWAVTGTGANAADTADFAGGALPSGTVAFAAGETSKIVNVNVAGDTAVEADETFAVTLSAPSGGATIGTAAATGTILAAGPVTAGLKINLIWNADAIAAPAGFRTAVQTAANLLQSAFSNNIVLNFHVGYGEVAGQALTNGSAAAGPSGGISMTTANLKTALLNSAASADDTAAYTNLSPNLNPNGNGSVVVWSAQEKALGLLAPASGGIDGEVGFATDISSNLLVGVALHEITHAMGRTSGYNDPFGIADLFRYSAAGTHVFAGGSAAYLSADGGATRIADFDTGSDFGDFSNNSALTVNDSFNAFYSGSTAQTLTSVDLRTMDILGYRRAVPAAAGGMFAAVEADSGTGLSALPGSAFGPGLADGAPDVAGSIVADISAIGRGLDSPGLAFLAPIPVVTLTDRPETLSFGFADGAEIVDGFRYGLDQLRIDLGSGGPGALQAQDTWIDGARAGSLFSSADPALGVVLRGLDSGENAATLMSSHLAFRDGFAIVA